MRNQENFWVLFSKKLAGEATAAELKQLEELIAEHPEWQFAIQNLEDLWKQKSAKDFSHEEDAYMLHIHRMEDMGIRLNENHERTIRSKNSKKKIIWFSAAAVAIAISCFFMLDIGVKKNKANPEIARHVNEITTRPGSKSRVELPDGSIVWLNAGSKLTYNKDFGKVKREVTLMGEGFFDVTKNKEKPFIINTSSITIKVLGTVFNVKAYQEDKQTETSLLHGSIEVVIKKRPNDKIILSPSEKLIVENDISESRNKTIKDNNSTTEIPDISNLVSINKLSYNPIDSAVAETEWINNKLIFRNESFYDLAIQMERWYNVQIEIKDDKIAMERLNGTLETETIAQALEALQVSTPFKYEKSGNNIIIHQ